MARRPRPLQWPFMVFAESMPEAAKLADPNTSAEERARINTETEASLAAVRNTADRNTQRARHAADHKLRDKVMADYVPGKRGEAKRLQTKAAKLTRRRDFPLRTVRGWIEQLRTSTTRMSAGALQSNWQTIYYGQMIRGQMSRQRRARPKKTMRG